jgi:nitroreductase
VLQLLELLQARPLTTGREIADRLGVDARALAETGLPPRPDNAQAQRATRWQAIAMDTFLAIVSRREVRAYDGRPIPDEVVTRILEAGRLSGSAGNQQPWRFVLLSGEAQTALAEAVSEQGNVRGAALVVALVVSGKGHVSFDAGRCAQNMLLAAWNEGVGGTPNGVADRDAANAVVGVADDESIAIVLSFGHPARPRNPESRSAEEWTGRARRKPLDELVERLQQFPA